MTNEQNDNNLSPDREQVLTELADMLGDTDPTYLEVKNIISQPEPETRAEPKPLEHRPGWMDLDGRVGAGLDDEQRQAEKVQRQAYNQRESRSQNRSAQSLINASIQDRLESHSTAQPQVLADAIENDNRIIHGVSYQRQQRGNHGEVDLLIENRKESQGDQGVMKHRKHGCGAIYPLKSKGNV